MLATISSATVLGAEGQPVIVEAHVSSGLPGFNIVGLPDTACREARDRVRAALLSSGLKWPTKRVTINLAPSGVRNARSQVSFLRSMYSAKRNSSCRDILLGRRA